MLLEIKLSKSFSLFLKNMRKPHTQVTQWLKIQEGRTHQWLQLHIKH